MASLYKIVKTFFWPKIPNEIEAFSKPELSPSNAVIIWSLKGGDWNSVLDYKTQSEFGCQRKISREGTWSWSVMTMLRSIFTHKAKGNYGGRFECLTC